MKDSAFAEATGYLRAIEKRILTSSGIDRAIDSPSPAEALRTLSQNSEYDFSAVTSVEHYDAVLAKERERVYALAYHLSPEPLVVDVASCKYDFHNVKVAVKAHDLKQEADHLFIGVTGLDPQTIQTQIFADDPKELPDHIRSAAQAAVKGFQESNDPQIMDMLLDKAMFAHMSALAKQFGNDFISEYVGSAIDFYNVKAFLRVKRMAKSLKFLDDMLAPGGLTPTDLFTEHFDKPVEALGDVFYYKYFGDMFKQALEVYEKTGNFAALEKLTDNHLMSLIRRAKYVAFGPELIFAYILAKENEIRQIRILMTCRLNNIPTEVLRERLRDNYA